MTAPKQHDWHRPNFFSRDICKRCFTPRTCAAVLGPCAGSPSRDDGPNLFATIEKTLVDYFDTTHHDTTLEEGEWFVDIGDSRIAISELALVIAQEVARAS